MHLVRIHVHKHASVLIKKHASVLLRNKLAILLCLNPQPKPYTLNLNPPAYTLNKILNQQH
jgi:hypothetical protein